MLLGAVFFFLVPNPSLFSQTGAPSDLNLVYKSAEQFWKLVVQRKRLEASKFLISEEQREVFLSWQEPPYFEPRVDRIKFQSDPNKVIVGLSVQFMAPSGQIFNRYVEQEWIYGKKRWLLNLDVSETNIFASRPVPTDLEKLVTQFKAGFRLKSSGIEIPPDAFGKSLPGSIEYEYEGPKDLPLEYVSGPEFLYVEGQDLKRLTATGVIRFVVNGNELFTNDNIPPLRLRVQSGSASEEFVIPVRWNGHAPYRWSFSPPLIEPDYQGEVRLEVLNQSEETWNPGAGNSSQGTLVSVSGPTGPVRPGETAVYVYNVAKPGGAPASKESVRQDSLVLYLNGATPTVIIRVPYPKPVVKQSPTQDAPPPSKEMLERLLRGVPPVVLPKKP